MSFFGSLFGKKPEIADDNLNKKFKNDDEDSESDSSSSSTQEEEEEKKYGIWGFLKRIIELVESKFSKQDHDEVKRVGERLNELGAKFLGEIKVGKSPRTLGVARGVKAKEGNEKSR